MSDVAASRPAFAAIRGPRAATALLLLPALLMLVGSFLLPLVQLVSMSFQSPKGPLAPYRELLGYDVYLRVFANTAIVAVVVTVLAVLIAYPIAFSLVRLSRRWRAVLFMCVLFPLWISVLVRTFAWMMLLERKGPINRFLEAIGAIDQPLSLLFNQTGVLIGMVHVLLPYAVLPIYSALVRIDPGLMRASEGLGASRTMTFRRVLLPLSMSGVATAAVLVFLLSLGFFITPALLGGSSSITLSMLIDSLVNERLDWELASAASVILVAATLVVLGLASRFVSPYSLAEGR